MNSRSSSFSSISDLFRPNNPKGLRSRDLSSTRLSVLKKEIQTDIHLIPLRFSVLIWFGALLCLLAYLIETSTKANASKDNLYLGCVLIGVDVVCGLFSFYQSFKSTKIMKTFNSMIPEYASCVRNGVLNSNTLVRNLVKGDIVHVKAGDVVPADIRIIDSKGFKVDNSSLTGESVAVSRGNLEGTANILESPNVAFFSTLCVEGWASGVVMCCGDLTALGRVAGLAARLRPAPSPLSREISRFMRYVSVWALSLGVFIAAASLALGYPFMQTTVFVIGMIVANVPEGLQPTITASLTLTAQHMIKKNCLIKNLEAIEALGACTTICSDKTGTLTENKMCVQHVWMANKTYSVTDSQFLNIVKNNQVFARTSPTQKLQIVEACQRGGGVVAVTGDGVNDAPALRRADIGISMGITGSQVSKQTADIILLDDNFATIVVGIEEGRKIFDNLKKSVCYILISNVPEILPVLMFILFSIPLPLGVMTILCIDLGTDMWPAVALSHEKAESDVMARPPRTDDPLVSCRMLTLVYGHLGLVEFAAGMFAYFMVMAEHGFYPPQLFGIRRRWDNEAVTDVQDSLGQEWTYAERKELERACQAAYFVAVVVTQMMNGIICKTRFNSLFHVGMKNHVLNAGLIFELILSSVICYVPSVNVFFRTYPLKWRWWFLALPFSAFMFAFDEFRKYCIRRKLFKGWYNDLTYY